MKLLIKPNLLLIASAIIIYSSCAAQSKLPSTWTAGTTLTISSSGGMLPESDYTLISTEASYAQHSYQQDEKRSAKTVYKFTQADLDGLMKVLKANSFDKIKTTKRTGIVYDMETTTITLSCGGHEYSVSIGATEEVTAGDEKRFSKVDTYIYQLMEKAKTPKANSK